MKRIEREAMAGFDEKNDALVTVMPIASGVIVDLRSKVEIQYGKHIRKLIEEVIREAGYDGIQISVKDNAAWDYTIKARILGALERGSKA